MTLAPFFSYKYCQHPLRGVRVTSVEVGERWNVWEHLREGGIGDFLCAV